jgi:hypothetical protein
MIRKSISRSKGIAKLSPKALSLFCLIIPHLDSYGKSNGNPQYVKAEMCPLIPWLTIPAIKKALKEIDANTNLKWFQEDDGTLYLHSTNWEEHQKLEKMKRGEDYLPSYPSIKVDDQSTSSRRVVGPEVEVEVKDQVEVEREVELEPIHVLPSPPYGGGGATPPQDRGNGKGESTGEIKESQMALIRKVKSEEHQKTLEALLGEVMRGSMERRVAITQVVNMRCLNRPEAELLFLPKEREQ